MPKNISATIVFLSSVSRYLDHNLYLLLARELKKHFKVVYFESDYHDRTVANKTFEQDNLEKREVFDELHTLKPFNPGIVQSGNLVGKLKNGIKSIKANYVWKGQFLEKLDALKPSAIILIDPHAYNSRLCRLNRRKVPQLYIQPALSRRSQRRDPSVLFRITRLVFNRMLRLPIIPTNKSIFLEDKQLHYIMWSKHWVQHIPDTITDKYTYTGPAIYDDLFRSASLKPKEKHTPVILIYLNKESNMGLENWKIYAQFYNSLIEQYPDFEYIIKPHPLGSKDLINEHFNAKQIVHELDPDLRPDLVLVHWSTASVESIAKGIPTILVNPDGKFNFHEFHLDEYPGLVETKKELGDLAKEFLDPGSSSFEDMRQSFMNKLMYKTDGKSLERTVNAILSITKDNVEVIK